MPKFIDFHAKLPQLPPGAIDEFKKTIGKRDVSGVTPLGAFFTADGQAYCLSEAPNAEAVCKAHEAKGLSLAKGDVHEVVNQIG